MTLLKISTTIAEDNDIVKGDTQRLNKTTKSSTKTLTTTSLTEPSTSDLLIYNPNIKPNSTHTFTASITQPLSQPIIMCKGIFTWSCGHTERMELICEELFPPGCPNHTFFSAPFQHACDECDQRVYCDECDIAMSPGGSSLCSNCQSQQEEGS